MTLITWYVISLASFCQAGSQSSAITCQIVWNNTIIVFTYCNLFKTKAHAFQKVEKKVPHTSKKTWFVQYKYSISANRQIASNWWCSWMWGWPPWFLKRQVHALVRGRGWGRVRQQPRVNRPRPALDWEVLGDPLGFQTLSQRINGNWEPPCQQRESPRRG